MDVSTPDLPPVTTPEAQMPELPTEIIERIFVSLMESFDNVFEAHRERSAKFAQLSIISRLFHALTNRNGYYSVNTGEMLMELWLRLQDPTAVSGMRSLRLRGDNATDLHIMCRIISICASAANLKRLTLRFGESENLGELEQFHYRRGLVMDALQGLKNVEHFSGEWGRFSNETALCRVFPRWSRLQELELNEGARSEGDDDDDDQPDLPSCLAQLTITSVARLDTLSIRVDNITRVELLERILSFGRITHLDVNIRLDTIRLDRLELAIQGAASRFKSFGNISPYFRPSFIQTLYPLLGRCETLNLEFFGPDTVSLPSPTQLLSLRKVSIFGVTRSYFGVLETFMLGRTTPLAILEVYCGQLDMRELEGVCASVGESWRESARASERDW